MKADGNVGFFALIIQRKKLMENNDIKSVYQAPTVPVEYQDEANNNFVIAGKWKRFFNYLIDYVAMIITIVVIEMLLTFLLGEEAMEPIWSLHDFVLGVLLMLIYYLPFELLTKGRTIGKLITGTKVVAEDGREPSAVQIFIRTFSRIVPFEAFSFLGEMGRGWHDTWSKTYVIECR